MKAVDYVTVIGLAVIICLIIILPIIFTRPNTIEYIPNVNAKNDLESQIMRISKSKKTRYQSGNHGVLSQQVSCTTDNVTCKLECDDDACKGQCVQCFSEADCSKLPFAPKGYACTNNKCVKNPCNSDCTEKRKVCGSDVCIEPCPPGCKENEYCSQDGTRCDPVDTSTVESWFTNELFQKIAPYAGISAIYTDDGLPLYTYKGFIEALNFMQTLSNPMYHGFAMSASREINKKELAAFFGNSAEEMGTGFTGPQVPSTTCSTNGEADTCSKHWEVTCKTNNDCKISVTTDDKEYDCNLGCDTIQHKCVCSNFKKPNWDTPSGYLCGGGPPPPDPDDPDAKPVDRNGSFGTGAAGLEGIVPQFAAAAGGCGEYYDVPIIDPIVKERLGGKCTDLCLQAPMEITPNPFRGMYAGQTGTQDGGCFFNNGTEGGFGNYACVSSDGTLMQGNPSSIKITNPATKDLFTFRTFDPNKLCPEGDPSCSCLDDDMACQYVGRGPTQLTGGANYTDCSMAFFGDMRLVRWPNLLTTVNRKDPLNYEKSAFLKNCASDKALCESALAFPGGPLPQIIIDTTPDARVLVWAASLFFWMDKYRSGFNGVSCHDSMINPLTMGIQCVNLIVNANSCSEVGNVKSFYYQAICRVLDVKPDKDVCPQKTLEIKCAKGSGGGTNKCPAFATGANPNDCWDPSGAFTTDGSPCCCGYSTVPDKADGATKCVSVGNRYNCEPTLKTCTLTKDGEQGTYLTKQLCEFTCNPPVEKCASDCPEACLMSDGTCKTDQESGEKVDSRSCEGWGGYWCPGLTPDIPIEQQCAKMCPKGCLYDNQCFMSDNTQTVDKRSCDGWNGYWCPGGGPTPEPPGPIGKCVTGSYDNGSNACWQPAAQYTSGNLTCCCESDYKPNNLLNPTKCIHI